MIGSEPRSFAPRIRVHHAHEVLYWTARLRTTPTVLVQVVEKVGDNPRAVATELGIALLD